MLLLKQLRSSPLIIAFNASPILAYSFHILTNSTLSSVALALDNNISVQQLSSMTLS